MIHLTPPEEWRLVAADQDGQVWLTRASMEELLHFGEINDFSQWKSSKDAVQRLRKTDHASFVLFDGQRSRLSAECRSRTGDRLYVRTRGDAYEVAAGIEHISAMSARHSRRFLSVWLANALSFPGFDYFLGSSPFDDIQLVMHGFRGDWDRGHGQVSYVDEELREESCTTGTFSEAIELCRNTLEDAVKIATRGAFVVAECSGGIDSSLIAVIAKKVCAERFQGGVYANYPYHEFREERPFAQSVADQEGFSLRDSDHRLCLYLGAMNHERQEDPGYEPSLSMAFWGQTLSSLDMIRDRSPATILNGHGGDLLFSSREGPYVIDNQPRWIPSDLWESVLSEIDAGLKWVRDPARFASGYRFVNPWLCRSLVSAFPGVRYLSPLSMRSVIDSFQNLRMHIADSPRALAEGVQKPIAHLVFENYLPKEVWLRRSKINFAGNFYRSWLNHGSERVSLIRRMGPALSAFGVDHAGLVREVTEMARGRKSSNGLVNAIVTYSLWRERLKSLTSGASAGHRVS